MSSRTLSRTLAVFVSNLNASQVPSGVISSLRLAVLDNVACMLAGVRDPLFVNVREHLQATHAGSSTVVGAILPSSVTGAAFANGALAHACDYDDSSWTMWGHPTAPLLPAVLAAAEMIDSSGAETLTAFAAGIEIEKVFGLLMQPGHYRRGWHPTATLGVFGATAGAGRVLGLSVEKLQAAFGIGASLAAGLRINAGTSTKPLHCGFAARHGLEAALLAGNGVTASPDAIDGPGGFLELYADDATRDIDRALSRLGNPYEVVDPGLSPKLYPCCSDLHCAVDGLFEIKAKWSLTMADVRRVRCSVAPLAAANVVRRDPSTPTDARFSLSYCVAAAFVHGRLGLSQFEPECLRDPLVREFEKRVEITTNAELGREEVFSSPAMVEIETHSGVTHSLTVREMRGHPKRPLTESDLVSKFRDCADGVLSQRRASALQRCILRLDSLASIREMMTLATPLDLDVTGETGLVPSDHSGPFHTQ
jgi:2-methylcitrate dehydratase PrpD